MKPPIVELMFTPISRADARYALPGARRAALVYDGTLNRVPVWYRDGRVTTDMTINRKDASMLRSHGSVTQKCVVPGCRRVKAAGSHRCRQHHSLEVTKPSPEAVEAGQREWQRKWESGEFVAEANAAKARLHAAAPDLLKACKYALSRLEMADEYRFDPTTLPMLRAAIAKAE